LILEAALGFISHYWYPNIFSYHFILGVFVAVFVAFLHTIVMFHFVGSGKEMKEAVALLGGEPEIIKDIKHFKARVFPFAFFSILLTIAAEVIGGGVDTGAIPSIVHLILAIGAVILNFIAFPIEYKILKKNLILIDLLDKKLLERGLTLDKK